MSVTSHLVNTQPCIMMSDTSSNISDTDTNSSFFSLEVQSDDEQHLGDILSYQYEPQARQRLQESQDRQQQEQNDQDTRIGNTEWRDFSLMLCYHVLLICCKYLSAYLKSSDTCPLFYWPVNHYFPHFFPQISFSYSPTRESRLSHKVSPFFLSSSSHVAHEVGWPCTCNCILKFCPVINTTRVNEWLGIQVVFYWFTNWWKMPLSRHLSLPSPVDIAYLEEKSGTVWFNKLDF